MFRGGDEFAGKLSVADNHNSDHMPVPVLKLYELVMLPLRTRASTLIQLLREW
ncbi:hypothetical protein MGWOODY_Hyp533 [hydrothermal vent metagenome]|uniref:Uncharacterized protein n=1 Tax=hydrothermal vent metagenome TaxID=652676 RepID=A0A160U3F0_9ZZZZ